MRFVMPVFFPAVPFGLAAILRRLDFPAGNHQLAELSFPQLTGLMAAIQIINIIFFRCVRL